VCAAGGLRLLCAVIIIDIAAVIKNKKNIETTILKVHAPTQGCNMLVALSLLPHG
jgi:hypothetical protein